MARAPALRALAPALACGAALAHVATSTSTPTPGRLVDDVDRAVTSARRFAVASTHFVPMYAIDYREHRARVRALGASASEDERRASRQILWRAVSERFLACARALGGIYVKAGQHLAAQPIAPKPFQIVLRALMDDAARRPFEEDRKTFAEETGLEIEEAFAEFDETPVASASLAQVYRAKTFGGEDVAVKIQQRPVARFLESDLFTIEGYYSLMEWLVPSLRFGWLAKETRRHMGEEMDFTREAANALKASKMLADEFDESELKIPRVHRHLSGKRVLTMEFVPGVRIDDVEALKGKGIDLADVAARIQKIFAQMTFVHGFVHADPHPGNILITDKGGIVLLDHGVYRTLDDDLRKKWANVWLSIIRSDDNALREATGSLGIDPDMSQFFKLILAVVPTRVVEEPLAGKSIKRNDDSSSDSFTVAEKRSVMKQIMGVKLEDQTKLFETLPRDLLLVLKANNLLRYVNEQLGSPVNRYKIIWKSASEGLAKSSTPSPHDDVSTIKRGAFARARAKLGDAVAISLLPLQLVLLKSQLAIAFWKVSKTHAATAAMTAAKTSAATNVKKK